MIEAKDLRIGNNFQNDEGNILTCFGVAPVDDSDQFNIWYGNELGFILLEEEAKPIPLTEEWLVKFGATIYESFGKYKQMVINGDKTSLICRVLDNGISLFTISGCNPRELNFINQCEFVHNFQNIAFELGQELTIKE
jgi:hypothetical protein